MEVKAKRTNRKAAQGVGDEKEEAADEADEKRAQLVFERVSHAERTGAGERAD